ncbi:hypothetical protein HQ590_10275, partial [bacterium]|nr:hypothetical protein [bacterium]
MNKAYLAIFSLLTLAPSVGRTAAPAGGFFVPRNGGYEGRIGQAHFFIDASAGGSFQIVSGEWPELERL